MHVYISEEVHIKKTENRNESIITELQFIM